MPGPRSGNYEVDDEGNLVEVGAAAPKKTAVHDRAGAAREEARRALRNYDLAVVVALVLLIAIAISMADIRTFLLIFTAAYLLVAIAMRPIFRRAVNRAGSKR